METDFQAFIKEEITAWIFGLKLLLVVLIPFLLFKLFRVYQLVISKLTTQRFVLPSDHWIRFKEHMMTYAIKFRQRNTMRARNWDKLERRIFPAKNDRNWNDSFYFSGFSLEKENVQLFTRLGFRLGRTEEWVTIKLPKYGTLNFDTDVGLPLSSGFSKASIDLLTFSEKTATERLKFVCRSPLEKWSLFFQGPCEDSDGRWHQMKINLEWRAIMSKDNKPFKFDFDTQLDAAALAKSLSQLPWSRQLFSDLENSTQHHYEQWGLLEGSVTVDQV
jgi:hypothetical protein